MRNVAQYVTDSISPAGQAAGLVCQLASFSPSTSYKFGIIDWPQTDRYNTVVLNSGVDTVVNMRAVEDYRALADAAQVLGDTADAAAYAASRRRPDHGHQRQAGRDRAASTTTAWPWPAAPRPWPATAPPPPATR